MKSKPSTEEAVAGLLNAAHSELATRERHIYREALHALVRLAKSELLMEMKANVKKLTAVPTFRTKEKTRQRHQSQRQQQFEFHQDR
jgi:hypothetical protein